MPPKKHPQKSAGSGTKKEQTTEITEGSHVVFGKGKGSRPKKDDRDGPPTPPRPDARKIIGGASWTGKLPVNLLSEHCQRQKWNKPEYSMRQMPSGPDQEKRYRSAVTLSTTNPKTRETRTLEPFQLPQLYLHLSDQSTALEARHFAAAYALFRVASMKNIHLTLPPQYRDLWKGEFSRLKDEDVKEGRGWKYDADPFAAEAKRQEIHADMQKRKEEKEKADEKALKLGLTIPGGVPSRSKAWDTGPKVELGQKIRMDIEQLVKTESIWNPYHVQMSTEAREMVIVELSNLGFRKSHIQEAASYCRDRDETLEWLLIHVPEDDLPRWSFPPGYSAGVSLASGDLGKEAKLKRLAAAGYSSDACNQALQEHNGDERAAAEVLQIQLVGPLSAVAGGTSQEAGESIWDEEMSILKAILAERFLTSTPFSCIISAETASSTAFRLNFTKPSFGYPSIALPIISVGANDLPAYVRLSATKQALLYAQHHCLGDMMIFSLIEWFETNLSGIVDNPGPLRALRMQTNHSPGETPANQEKKPLAIVRQRAQDGQANHHDDRLIYEQWKSRQSTPVQRQMIESRKRLPAWGMREEIVEAVTSHQIVIISGETGSGKSTQSVQFILDDCIQKMCGGSTNIICTQPRRISALGLSDRVSQERCSREGDEVGYIIRGDSRVTNKTKITFMTTGVLLRRLQSYVTVLEALQGISHIFIDEVHERNLDTDFLLALLRDALKQKPDLKVILMSATLDSDIFSDYFRGSQKVGRVHIEGRTFPIQDYYLDDVVKFIRSPPLEQVDRSEEGSEIDFAVGKAVRDLGIGVNYDVIADLVQHIDTELQNAEGAILIFLPGTLEIDRCLRTLQRVPHLLGLPLHASLLPSEQRRVFPAAPAGKRKVIAATNVAETSITIEDVVAVIDTGRVKETTYDITSNVVRLEEIWASQAACRQRRGRAGRVRAGKCYKLYTRKAEGSMTPRPKPEMERVPLEQLCLSVKATGTHRDIGEFLASTLTPPDTSAVANAIKTLHRMSALEANQLTGLGIYLARIPADLKCAKLLVYACIFGCLEACLTIAATLTVKSPFVSPREKREEAKEARLTFPSAHGDLLLDLSAYEKWVEMNEETHLYREKQRWCSERFLSHQTLRDIASNRVQLLDSLKDAGLVPLNYLPTQSQALNLHNENMLLLRALVAAALSPQIARIEFPDKKYIASITGAKELDPDARTIKYHTEDKNRVFVHPSSALFDAQSYTHAATYLSYFSKMATSKTFIRDLTPFNAFALLLFGGPIQLDTSGRGLVVDGWLRLQGWARIGVLISRLRTLLDSTLRKRTDHSPAGIFSSGDEKILYVVKKLVELNGLDQ